MKIKSQVFNPYKSWTSLVGRPLQKSVDWSGRPTCTNVHGSLGWWAGRPSRELCSLEMAPVDRPVDRQRAAALCIQSRSIRRSTGGTTVRNLTVGRSTGRSTGRTKLPFPAVGQNSYGAINTPFLGYFKQVFREQFFPPLQVFNNKFLKEFLGFKDHSLFVLKCWNFKEN